MSDLITLQLKIPRNSEITPEPAQNFLSALTSIPTVSSLQKLFKKTPPAFALEIFLQSQQIVFQVVCDKTLEHFVETQIQSNYPLVIIEKTKDILSQVPDLKIRSVILKHGNNYPISTFQKFTDIDPLASVLSVFSKSNPDTVAVLQIALSPAGSSWQSKGARYAAQGTKNTDGSYSPRGDKSVIDEKISFPGFNATLRIASNSESLAKEITDSLSVFDRPDGNALKSKKVGRLRYTKEKTRFLERQIGTFQVLNISEIATLWHLPSEKVKTPLIAWGTSVLSEPPENLPAGVNSTEEEKKEINFFARTIYKNADTTFGIKTKDRTRHIWALGKTGTGKSTLIANMAIDDLKKGRGLGVIDPHGDLCEEILNFIPSDRINDVIYFNPADRDFPVTINPLEVKNQQEAELVVSGIMSIFTKVWANVWSARMEYILRNSLMTLSSVPDTTLADVLRILSDESFRNKIVAKTQDEALVHFWQNEFAEMPDKLQKEAISPIQNKVGQFVTSPLIRRIIGNPKSTISIDDIINQGKILLVNLSQGRLGEDNAQLLGAMLITKFQVSAMGRVDVPIEQRRPFYLYVDEFQNFATDSFVKILSEARKYQLALTLANQYMAQIPDTVQKAILGNAGTIISFSAGAEDASILHKEFAEVFSENDLVNLSNYQIALKLMIDGRSSRPFVATTLPLPMSRNENKDKIIRVSRERWARKSAE